MASSFASFLCKISFEVSDTTTIMKSKSSTMSTVCSFGLLALDFFRNVGFMGETFLLLDGSASSGGLCGSVTLPCFCLSSSPSFSSLSTSSSPPPLGEYNAVSSDVLLSFYTSSFFFFLLLLGASYASRVTTGFPMRYGSDSSAWSTGIRNSCWKIDFCH
jgi:hypothetical protein